MGPDRRLGGSGPDLGGAIMISGRMRFGLLPKIIVFLAAVLIPLAAITWSVSVRTMRERMTDEFTSKGTAIANSLASSGVDLILNRDASTVQARVDEVISGKDAISGVAYVMVYDPQKTLIAHTFHPRSEEHTSELQSRLHLVCRLLLEKKK